MKRYKVVYNLGGGYSSLFVNEKGYNLYYAIGEVTTKAPDTVGIFVFDTLKNASNFVRDLYGNRNRYSAILEVQPIGRGIRLRSRPTYYGINSLKRLKEFFDSNRLNMIRGKINIESDEFNIKYTNDGTMVYDAVKVVRDIGIKR